MNPNSVSFDMGPIFVKNSFKKGPILWKIAKNLQISHFWGENL